MEMGSHCREDRSEQHVNLLTLVHNLGNCRVELCLPKSECCREVVLFRGLEKGKEK